MYTLAALVLLQESSSTRVTYGSTPIERHLMRVAVMSPAFGHSRIEVPVRSLVFHRNL